MLDLCSATHILEEAIATASNLARVVWFVPSAQESLELVHDKNHALKDLAFRNLRTLSFPKMPCLSICQTESKEARATNGVPANAGRHPELQQIASQLHCKRLVSPPRMRLILLRAGVSSEVCLGSIWPRAQMIINESFRVVAIPGKGDARAPWVPYVDTYPIFNCPFLWRSLAGCLISGKKQLPRSCSVSPDVLFKLL